MITFYQNKGNTRAAAGTRGVYILWLELNKEGKSSSHLQHFYHFKVNLLQAISRSVLLQKCYTLVELKIEINL